MSQQPDYQFEVKTTKEKSIKIILSRGYHEAILIDALRRNFTDLDQFSDSELALDISLDDTEKFIVVSGWTEIKETSP